MPRNTSLGSPQNCTQVVSTQMLAEVVVNSAVVYLDGHVAYGASLEGHSGSVEVSAKYLRYVIGAEKGEHKNEELIASEALGMCPSTGTGRKITYAQSSTRRAHA